MIGPPITVAPLFGPLGLSSPTGRHYLADDTSPPVAGWRFWYVQPSAKSDQHPLITPYRSQPWPPGPVTATCGQGNAHEAANPACNCGFTSGHTRDDLLRYVAYWSAGFRQIAADLGYPCEPLSVTAVGVVDAPGRRCTAPFEPPGFYRHRWAVLRALWLPADLAHHKQRLADHYAVPVTVGTASGEAWLDALHSRGIPRPVNHCVHCNRDTHTTNYICQDCRSTILATVRRRGDDLPAMLEQARDLGMATQRSKENTMHDDCSPVWEQADTEADEADQIRRVLEKFIDVVDRSDEWDEATLRAELRQVADRGRVLPSVYTAELRQEA